MRRSSITCSSTEYVKLSTADLHLNLQINATIGGCQMLLMRLKIAQVHNRSRSKKSAWNCSVDVGVVVKGVTVYTALLGNSSEMWASTVQYLAS
jgi:hypothetical protein